MVTLIEVPVTTLIRSTQASKTHRLAEHDEYIFECMGQESGPMRDLLPVHTWGPGFGTSHNDKFEKLEALLFEI